MGLRVIQVQWIRKNKSKLSLWVLSWVSEEWVSRNINRNMKRVLSVRRNSCYFLR